MDKAVVEYTTIDEYIAQFTDEIQEVLNELRTVIKKAAPDALEKISYQMPTFWQAGNLVHFAVHKHHLGFYPTPSAIEKFSVELSGYQHSKGAIQFPLDRPIPYDLVSRMVAFRVQENSTSPKKK
jgi:uncharacterized protein YdhG (YjbR/CyaY superfamily)